MSYKTDLRKLGANIYKEMQDAGLTQAMLAEETCISMRTLSNWMRGINEPGAIRLKIIASAIGCSMDDLLEGIGDEYRW